MNTILVGVLSLFVLGNAGFFYLGKKSQDGSALGLVAGKLAPCPSSPNCVSSEDNVDDEKKVEPLPVTAWGKLPALVTELGGVWIKQEANYMAAEFTSSTFKFVDDLEFRLAEEGVHVRSASRVGYSDRGVNLVRVETLRQGLNN